MLPATEKHFGDSKGQRSTATLWVNAIYVSVVPVRVMLHDQALPHTLKCLEAEVPELGSLVLMQGDSCASCCSSLMVEIHCVTEKALEQGRWLR